MEPSPLYGSLDRYTSCDTHCSLSSINRSLTLPRNSSNLSSSKQAKKKVPCGTVQDVPANTLVLSCEIFDIPTVGDLIDTPVDTFRVDPPTNFSDDAINRQESQELATAHQGSGRRLDCKNLVRDYHHDPFLKSICFSLLRSRPLVNLSRCLVTW